MKYIDDIIKYDIENEKNAIIQSSYALTYGELSKNAYSIAQYLIDIGVTRKDRIALFLNKSVDSITAIFGILKTGAAYIPIDPDLPQDRVDYIIKTSQPKAIIMGKGSPSLGIDYNIISIFLERDSSGLSIDGNSCNKIDITTNFLKLNRDQQDVAYIIFTSGSTGKPKGVMIKHESLSHFVSSITNVVKYYNSSTKYLSIFPIHFDGSIVDIFPTIYKCGSLIIMENLSLPNNLLAAIEKYRITLICIPSTLLKLLASRLANIKDYDLSSLNAIWYGTENCPSTIVRYLQEKIPNVTFIHSYGPTEATCTSHLFVCRNKAKLSPGPLPIGKPLPGVHSLVLDSNMNTCPAGKVGELYLGGTQVMLGYCGDEIRTKKSLINGLLEDDAIFYKTGDFVCVSNNGNYYFIGRNDDMIKSGGNLIYLNEIEKSLLLHNDIEDAFVKKEEDTFGIIRPVAFIVEKKGKALSKSILTQHILQSLPSYMLPYKFHRIDRLEVPKLKSGKTNKRSLATYNYESID